MIETFPSLSLNNIYMHACILSFQSSNERNETKRARKELCKHPLTLLVDLVNSEAEHQVNSGS